MIGGCVWRDCLGIKKGLCIFRKIKRGRKVREIERIRRGV